MEPIIEFKNYSFKYNSQVEPTLRDIDLSVYPGEKILIIGPSGSGKSTLLKLISGNDSESHVKAAKRNNRIEIPALPNRSKTVFQGELFNDYNNNKDLYPDGRSLFSEINCQDFRLQITTFANRVMEWVRRRIGAK
mgnify:CR=1 FL=1